MPILKDFDARPRIKDAVVLDLGDLAAQGERLLESARQRAQDILASARREAAAMTAAASEAGRDVGHAEGLTAGKTEGHAAGHAEAAEALRAEAAPLVASLTAAARAFETQRASFEQAALNDTLRLAIAMGRKVTHRQVTVDPSVVQDQVAVALRRVLEPTDLRLRVHPEDRPLMTETLPDLLAGLAHLGHVTLVDDPAVGRGGCAIDLPGGAAIDAALEGQLDRIVEQLLPPGEEGSAAAEPGEAAEARASDPAAGDEAPPLRED